MRELLRARRDRSADPLGAPRGGRRGIPCDSSQPSPMSSSRRSRGRTSRARSSPGPNGGACDRSSSGACATPTRPLASTSTPTGRRRCGDRSGSVTASSTGRTPRRRAAGHRRARLSPVARGMARSLALHARILRDGPRRGGAPRTVRRARQACGTWFRSCGRDAVAPAVPAHRRPRRACPSHSRSEHPARSAQAQLRRARCGRELRTQTA